MRVSLLAATNVPRTPYSSETESALGLSTKSFTNSLNALNSDRASVSMTTVLPPPVGPTTMVV